METYGLPTSDAAQLALERAAADFFEEAAKLADPKLVSNWMLGDLTRLANAAGQPVYSTPVTPQNLAGLIALIQDGTITGKIAKELIEDMHASGKTAPQLVEEKGIKVVDAGAVVAMVDAALAANPDAVARYKAGQEKLLGFFVGQVMKEAKGQARPDDVNRLVKEALDKLD